MNYYEHHLGDYAKDTAHLSMLEHGAYRLLLDRYYGSEQGIPADQAHRIARARTKDEKAAVDVVLAEFFKLVDGLWINKRADEEIAKAKVKIAAAQENGKKGGRPRGSRKTVEKETQQKPGGFSVGSENETQQKAHQSPITNHQTPEGEQAASTAQPLPPEQPPISAADPIHGRAIELTAMLRQRGAALQASDPRVRAWAESGVTDAQALAALETAQQRREDQRNPQPINAGYLDSIIRDPPTANARASPPPARSGRAARIDNYAAQAAEARGENGEQRGIRGTERDITGEVVIVA